MKRLFLFVAILVLAGCQDQAMSPAGGPALAVSDGAHLGSDPGDACVDGSPTWPQCQGTFFLTPIVEQPEFSGTPNGNLLPEVIITELPTLANGDPDASSLSCVVGGVVRRFSDIAADPLTGEYSVSWNTGEDDLADGSGQRICVRIPRGDGTYTDMAYRDVQAVSGGAEVPRNVAQLPIYQYNNGRNLPISFVILNGTLCGLEDNIDCTEGLLGPNGGTLVCDDERCGLAVPPGALNEPTLLFVELLNCEDVGGPRNHLGIEVDVPIGPGCFEVSAPDVGGPITFNVASGGATVGACVDLSAFALQGHQDELLQILHARADGQAEFLPQVPFPAPLSCLGFTQTAEAAHPLLKLARSGLRAVQRTLLPWVSPEPLHAIDQGFGGGSLLSTSPFVWGLPSQFERGMWDGSQFVSWTDPEIGQVGGTLTPAVRVLDGGTPDCDPTAGTCFAQSPVQGARVRFEVTAGGGTPSGEQPINTNAAGIAYLDWTLGEDNPNILEARGIGIGCVEFDDDGNGTDDCEIRDGSPPPSIDGTGIFGDNDFGEDPFQRERVDIATGVISFEALACAPGASVDGIFGAGEYPAANQQGFMAKLSGGEVPATLYWTNDCDNLYIALVVKTTDVGDNVSLRLIFDNDADGVPAADDDVLFLEKLVDKKTKTSSWVFQDHYLTADCLNSTQSSCSAADVSDGGTRDGEGVFGASGTFGVYEISHPLKSGDTNHDFQLDLGDATAYFAVLQLGNGSKGNTEVLDFRTYIPVQITASGGF